MAYESRLAWEHAARRIDICPPSIWKLAVHAADMGDFVHRLHSQPENAAMWARLIPSYLSRSEKDCLKSAAQRDTDKLVQGPIRSRPR